MHPIQQWPNAWQTEMMVNSSDDPVRTDSLQTLACSESRETDYGSDQC